MPTVSDVNIVVSAWNYTDGYCELNGNKYYKTCKCAAGMSQCGSSSGYGAITGGTVCYDNGTKDDNGNWFGGTKYYSQCSCGSGYVDCSSLGGSVSGTASGSTCTSYSGELFQVNSVWSMENIQTTVNGTQCVCPTHNESAIINPSATGTFYEETYYVASEISCSGHTHNSSVGNDSITVTCSYDAGQTCVNYSSGTSETRYKCYCSVNEYTPIVPPVTPSD